MTKKTQEAYIRGFCKAAKAYGVNPQELAKTAAIVPMAKYLGNGLLNKGKRFWELLLGGNKDLVGGYNAAKKTFADAGTKNGKRALEQLTSARFGGPLKTKSFSIGGKKYDMATLLDPKTIAELDKVLAARLGAGAAGLAGLGYLTSGGPNYYNSPHYYNY